MRYTKNAIRNVLRGFGSVLQIFPPRYVWKAPPLGNPNDDLRAIFRDASQIMADAGRAKEKWLKEVAPTCSNG